MAVGSANSPQLSVAEVLRCRPRVIARAHPAVGEGHELADELGGLRGSTAVVVLMATGYQRAASPDHCTWARLTERRLLRMKSISSAKICSKRLQLAARDHLMPELPAAPLGGGEVVHDADKDGLTGGVLHGGEDDDPLPQSQSARYWSA